MFYRLNEHLSGFYYPLLVGSMLDISIDTVQNDVVETLRNRHLTR